MSAKAAIRAREDARKPKPVVVERPKVKRSTSHAESVSIAAVEMSEFEPEPTLDPEDDR